MKYVEGLNLCYNSIKTLPAENIRILFKPLQLNTPFQNRDS